MTHLRLTPPALLLTGFLVVSGLAGCGTLHGDPPPPAGYHEAAEGQAKNSHFAYTGDRGPGFWGELREDWKDCATNPRQSPVNITGAVEDPSLGRLDLTIGEVTLNLYNNGHDLEQTYGGRGTLKFEGVTYTLARYHFHTLSEHTVDGKWSVMELHAVFENQETQTAAVIGVLYQLGAENAFLARFDQRLPRKSGDRVVDRNVRLNLREGLTGVASYTTYPGSLTTPGCAPTVTWIVLSQQAELSLRQFKAFQGIMGNNFRPLQDLGTRPLRRSPTPVDGP